MKARITDKDFKSFELTLTIETEREAAALFGLFNYTPLIGILEFENPEEVRRAIEKGCNGNTPPYSLFHARLKEHVS